MNPENKKIETKNKIYSYIVVTIILLIIVGVVVLARKYDIAHGIVISKISYEFDSISQGEADVIKSIDKAYDNGIDSLTKEKITNYKSSLAGLSTSTAGFSDTQYVILSFDGSRSLEMWKETRQFAKDMTNQGKPVHFTYFINPIYLLTKDSALKLYQPPRERMGDSKIGYADSEQDVKDRVEQINLASSEGNEIGSHNVGHFNGSKWSYSEWLQESNSFDSIMANVQKNNPNVVIPPWTFDTSKIFGFRAPELGVNSDLYKVLADKHYLYDASGIRKSDRYPFRDQNGIWHIGLGIINITDLHSDNFLRGKTRKVLSMDYNFWMVQSNVINVAKRGSLLWNEYFAEVKNSYEDYFNKNYNGNHAPVVIGHHFSSWNDGVYWEAMKSFSSDVCGKPKVKCVTFKEYADYLNSATNSSSK